MQTYGSNILGQMANSNSNLTAFLIWPMMQQRLKKEQDSFSRTHQMSAWIQAFRHPDQGISQHQWLPATPSTVQSWMSSYIMSDATFGGVLRRTEWRWEKSWKALSNTMHPTPESSCTSFLTHACVSFSHMLFSEQWGLTLLLIYCSTGSKCSLDKWVFSFMYYKELYTNTLFILSNLQMTCCLSQKDIFV